MTKQTATVYVLFGPSKVIVTYEVTELRFDLLLVQVFV